MIQGGIPSEAIGVSVVVLLYSFVCAFLSSILVGLLFSFGERFSFVTIQVFSTGVATLAAIIQQIHYAARWQEVQQAKFDGAVIAQDLPGLTLIGGSHKVDRGLFLVQFWCYNITAMNILFWAVTLFVTAWDVRTTRISKWHAKVSLAAKVFSICFPGIIIGTMHSEHIQLSRARMFVVGQGTICISLVAAAIFLLLTLYRYVRTRYLASAKAKRGKWWALESPRRSFQKEPVMESQTMARIAVSDRALVIRFTIGFVVLFFFLGCIVMFANLACKREAALLIAGKTDLHPSNAIKDILLFLPGVSGSLFTFLIFGTTKSWQHYRDLLICKANRFNISHDKEHGMRRHLSLKNRRKREVVESGFDFIDCVKLDDLHRYLDAEIKQSQPKKQGGCDLKTKPLPLTPTTLRLKPLPSMPALTYSTSDHTPSPTRDTQYTVDITANNPIPSHEEISRFSSNSTIAKIYFPGYAHFSDKKNSGKEV